MKKRILSAMLAMVLMAFTSCCTTSEENSTKKPFPLHIYSNAGGKIRLFVDPETKVNYLFYDGGSMIPRIDKDGKPIVGYPE